MPTSGPTLPSNFRFEAGTRVGAPLSACVRVFYKGVCIALAIDELAAWEYVRVYGYLAEWRMHWNLGNRVSWSEDLRVQV